jgi:hypothetical protein
MEEKLMLKDKSTHVLITFVTMFAVQGALAANTSPTPMPKQVVADYTRPLSFEPNRGQADKRVDFLAHGTGYGLFLSYSDAVMTFEHGTAVRMRAVGANAFSQPEPLDPQTSKSNYFIGNVPEHWHTNVPNYTRVRYRDIYAGVDLIYYGNQRQLEYDFVLAPGADPDKILLDFQGTSKANLDREGNVVMQTTAGHLRWHKPVAYQEAGGLRRLVGCAYVRKGGQLGFKIAPFDRTKPLIIDPVLEYSTYLGGSGGEEGHGIAVDTNGNAYVTGNTLSTDFPTKNAFQSAAPGGSLTPNAFITKFNAAGELVYSTYLGGTGRCCPPNPGAGDSGNAIAVDVHGDAYVTGTTTSSDFPVKNAFQNKLPTLFNGAAFDAFVTKLDSAGSELVYSTYLGGGADLGNAIAVDRIGHAYVTGTTSSSDFPTKDAFQKELRGSFGNAFVTKFDAAGTALVYSTFLGGGGQRAGFGDEGHGIAVDAQGNAYVTGSTGSTDFPIKDAFQDKLKSTYANAFVTKFDRAGSELVYSTYLGGSGSNGFREEGNGIAVDTRGNAYITGFTNSADFPTKNAFQRNLKNPSAGNAFVTKFDAAGTALVYSTYLGGSASGSGDSGQGIAVDRHGEAYVTGFTASTDFPTKNAFQGELKSRGPFTNAFITKVDAADCALVYSSYLGGSGSDFGNGIAVDARGNAYITGQTVSPDFPTKDAFQPVSQSVGFNQSDAFVTKISAH